MRLALSDECDLRRPLDERADQQWIGMERIGRGDDDRAVLEARLAHPGHGPHEREVLRPRRRHEADLGRATVKLSAQLVGIRYANDVVAGERHAVAEAIAPTEVVPAEEDRAG